MIWVVEKGVTDYVVKLSGADVSVWFAPTQHGKVKALFCSSHILDSGALLQIIRDTADKVAASGCGRRFGARLSRGRLINSENICAALNEAGIAPFGAQVRS